MTLLQMSFYGAVIILATLVIRTFTLHKLPKKTFLILWGVALLRLLVPFEISSGFSLYSLLPEAPEKNVSYIPDKTQLSNDDAIVAEPDGGAVYLPNEPPDMEAIHLPDTETAAEYTGGTATAPDSQTSTGLQTLWNSLVPFLPMIWATGMLLCAAFFLISYIRCYREFCTSLPVTTEYVAEWLKQHSLKRTITIRQSDKISAPLTYGIFRPVILLPKKADWENTTQLDYVLYHEFTHIRRFDLLAKLVMIAALCLHWFNPFVWVMYVFFNRDLELSCDDCVLKHFGETKSAYANTLIGMEEKRNYGAPLCNHFSKTAIEERITAIMKSKKTTFSMLAAAVILVAVVILTLTTGRKDTDVIPEITPIPTTTPTLTKAPTAEPAPAPGNIFYFPERNYTYHEDDLAVFNYSSSTVSPTDGYDFIISSLVSEDGSPVLSDVTINLEAYAGNTAWWCLAAFYDKYTGRFYLEFVPAAGVENAPAGVLHVTVPVANPTGYTVLPTGDFYAQKSSAFWFGEIRKIRNRIYFNNGFYDGTLWVLDITTGEMQDLSYVNEKMREIANELCSGFGWDHQPAIWFNAAQQQGKDTYVYTASVCKEMDTETIYTLHLYYEGDTFIVSHTTYHGSTEQPPSIEELTSLCQEQFFRYRNMQEELFDTNLKVSSVLSSDDMVAINGESGYTKVTDVRFQTLQSVIDYMETICTPDFAKLLRNQNWRMNSQNPTLAELDGELYTKCYDAVSPKTSYSFAPINYDGPDICTLSYEAYIGIPANKTESGTITFRCIDGNWYVNNHTYTYCHDYVDGLDLQNITELFTAYRTMYMQLFNSCLECGMHSHQPAQDVTINGVDHYYKVLDERFPTLQSVIEYMETICTPELAEKLHREYLGMGSDYPLLSELNGELYTQYYSSSTTGYFTDFQFTGLKYTGADTVTAGYQSSGVSPDVIEVGTITFYITPEGWRIASIDYDYKSLTAKDFPTFPAGETVVTETGWNLTFLDEPYLPSYSQLKDAGGGCREIFFTL